MDADQFIPMSIAAVAAVAAIVVAARKPRAGWKFVNVKSDFTTEHHLPEVLPVPASDAKRAETGEFSFDDAIGWMKQFMSGRRKHPLRGQFELAIRKADVYKALSERMGRGRWGEVDELASRLAEIDPLDPSAALARGRANRELGQFNAAVKFYQQALKLQPTHSTALPEFAATCRSLGQPHRFSDALAVARTELGETHPLTIESRVALGELVRVFADPTDPATVAHIPREQYLKNIQSRIEEMDPDPDVAISAAAGMLGDDMPELAERVLERFELTFHDHADTWLLRGMIHRYHRDLSAAEEALRESLARGESVSARVEYAQVLTEKARQHRRTPSPVKLRAEAESQLRMAIESEPNHEQAINLLIEPALRDGADGAARLLEQLTGAYPGAWAPWKVLADIYNDEDRAAEAIAAYEAALTRGQGDGLLLNYLNALEKADRRGDLCPALDKIKDLPKRDPMLRWRASQAYFESGRIDEARRLLEGLMRDEQANPVLRQRAGTIVRHMDAAAEKDAKE